MPFRKGERMKNKFLSWLGEPLRDILGIENIHTVETDVDLGTPIISHEEPPTPPMFKPLSWDEYIGQSKAKFRLQTYIKGIREKGRIFPHTLIHGRPGTGKTTLARIIAHELDKKLIEAITSSVQEFWKFKMLIEQNPGQVIFLDEIHALKRDMAEQLYSMMEYFTYNGKPVPPFTLIGATTEVGEIIKNIKPFYDRCIIIPLEGYKIPELVRITQQFKRKAYKTDPFNNLWYRTIGENCRGVPRHAIRLLQAAIYFKDIDEVLRNHGIIKDGYTDMDLKALKYIASSDKGAGLQSIASFMDMSIHTYMYDIEPFILQTGLIIRSPRGRKITEQGLRLVDELDKLLPKE